MELACTSSRTQVFYPPLRTRCDGWTFVRLIEDWPPRDEVGVPCASWCCTNHTV